MEQAAVGPFVWTGCVSQRVRRGDGSRSYVSGLL